MLNGILRFAQDDTGMTFFPVIPAKAGIQAFLRFNSVTDNSIT